MEPKRRGRPPNSAAKGTGGAGGSGGGGSKGGSTTASASAASPGPRAKKPRLSLSPAAEKASAKAGE